MTSKPSLALSKEYIKNNSISDINIDYRAKRTIMDFGERSAYASLRLVSGINTWVPIRRSCDEAWYIGLTALFLSVIVPRL